MQNFFEPHNNSHSYMRKKPSKNKNFFQNYADHIDYLNKVFHDKYDTYRTLNSDQKILNLIKDTALARLNIFEQLRDAHDYTDEIIGASVIPALSMIASIATLALSIWETTKSLMIYLRWRQDDYDNHLNNAGKFLMSAVAAFLLAAISFLKSAISLIIRPIITAIRGFAPQDKERFCTNGTYKNA